ncbi:MAG: hypothetical protein II871_03300 [Clostridia bacterium]|nr:hypothetical protein [Clostridia bacterium]
MNKKEFKRAMLCGLGRCILACQNDPERYRAEVMWGCTHQLAYDAQCEARAFAAKSGVIPISLHTMLNARAQELGFCMSLFPATPMPRRSGML